MTVNSLAGHDLGGFEPVEGITPEYLAECRQCGKTAWVGENGLLYSLLGVDCQVLV